MPRWQLLLRGGRFFEFHLHPLPEGDVFVISRRLDLPALRGGDHVLLGWRRQLRGVRGGVDVVFFFFIFCDANVLKRNWSCVIYAEGARDRLSIFE